MKNNMPLRLAAALVVLSIASAALATSGSATYTYDDAGRLTSVIYENGTGQIYNYDPAGNRTSSGSVSPAVFSVTTSASVAEGSPVTLTVTRSNNTSSAASVNYAVVAGSAVSATNYTVTQPTGTLNFTAGQTSQSVTVQTVNDSRYDGAINFGFQLSNPSSSAVISQDLETVTINEASPAPMFSVAAASATEGTPVSFIITRSNATSLTQSVSYSTSDGTAVNGTDYQGAPTSQTLAFGPSGTTQTVQIATIDDTLYEGSRAFNLTLSNATNGAAIGAQGSATGTVTDNESPPLLSVNSPAVTASAPITFTVTETFPAGSPPHPATGTRSATTVNWATANGTAIAGTNYTANSGSLTFPAGATNQTQTFTVQTLQPASQSGAVAFSINFSGANNSATVSPTPAIGTINAAPAQIPSVPTLSPNSQTHTTTSFHVSWTASLYNPTRYELWVVGGSSAIYSGTATTYTGTSTGDLDYEVRACNAVGCSAYSNQAEVIICPTGSCN